MRTMRRRREREATPEHKPEARAAESPATVQSADLAEIDAGVRSMFASLPERLEASGEAFLGGDRDAARCVVESDPAIDALQADIEALVQVELARQPVAPDDLRYLVTVLRIVPELERSADLVEHIALRAQPALCARLSNRAHDLVWQMTTTGAEMWRVAGDAFEERDATAIALLRTRDDRLDDLHVQLTDEFAADRLGPSIAIELGLVARFLERLGDHAVNVVGRLAYLTESGTS
jgi:phosphate transport system protein